MLAEQQMSEIATGALTLNELPELRRKTESISFGERRNRWRHFGTVGDGLNAVITPKLNDANQGF